MQHITEATRLNYEQNMHDAIAVFPRLQTGLDVNVKFTGYVHCAYVLIHVKSINYTIGMSGICLQWPVYVAFFSPTSSARLLIIFSAGCNKSRAVLQLK